MEPGFPQKVTYPEFYKNNFLAAPGKKSLDFSNSPTHCVLLFFLEVSVRSCPNKTHRSSHTKARFSPEPTPPALYLRSLQLAKDLLCLLLSLKASLPPSLLHRTACMCVSGSVHVLALES
ncbi:hypothetical protein GOODEAATRI_025946, partial [Goodea atripinnis]